MSRVKHLKRMLAGILTAVMLAGTVAQPVTISAAENPVGIEESSEDEVVTESLEKETESAEEVETVIFFGEEETAEAITQTETDTEEVELCETTTVVEDELSLEAGEYFNLSNEGKRLESLTAEGKKQSSLTIPDGVEEIAYGTFSGNKIIEEVILPETLRKLGGSVFEGAEKLSKINLSNVEEVATGDFKGCISLKEADISKVKNVGASMFEGCTALETVDFSGAENFSMWAFKDCTSLKNISEFGDKVIGIQMYLFQNSGIEEIRLPYYIKRVNAYAFDGCAKLKDIYVYRNVNADVDSISCDVNQNYWPKGKDVTVHCVKGSFGDKFAGYLGNTIDYMAITPAESMKVTRKDGGDASDLAYKFGDVGNYFIVDIGPKYCNQEVTYTTSDRQIADIRYIDEEEEVARGRYNFAVVPVNKEGTAKVTVKCGNLRHVINVSVGVAATSIEVFAKDRRYGGDGTSGIKILPGNEVKIDTKVKPDNAVQAVTFKSLDPEVATVNSDGVIKAVAPGVTNIRVIATDGSNTYRDIEVTVPYVIEINNASDIHCLKGDEGWLDFGGSQYKHPGIIWRYTPKRAGAEKIEFTFAGALGKSGFIAVCYGDGTEAANCSSAKRKEPETIGWFHASAYREEIGGATIYAEPKQFAIYYSFGDCGDSNGFSVSSFREYGKTFNISYVNSGDGVANPNKYESGDIIILNSPTRNNYTFDGWYLGNEKLPVNEKGKSVLDTTSLAENITLKARWTGALHIPAVKLVVTDREGTNTTYESSKTPITVEKGSTIELTNEVYDVEVFYTTDGREPDSDSLIYHGGFTVNRTMTVKAFATMPGQEPSITSEWTIDISKPEDDPGDVRSEDILQQFDGDISKIPHGVWVAGYDEEIQYTGANITFSDVRVYDYKTLLSPKTDYALTYKNNKKAYSLGQVDEGFDDRIAPKLIITGKGNYSTAMTVYFKIIQRDISITDASNITRVSDITLAAGRGQKPVPSVKWNDTVLKAKTDYTYEYRDNSDKVITEVKEAGDYNLVIKGCGNYKGTKVAPIKVVDPLSTNLLSKMKVSSLPSVEYKAGGYSTEDIYNVIADPNNKVTVMNGKTPLTIAVSSNDLTGQYYVKEVINSERPGNATVVIEATEASEYAGCKELKLVIKGNAISKAKFFFVSGEELLTRYSAPYTGDVIEPAVMLTYPISRTETVTLDPKTDYTVSYANNILAGSKATVIITGKGAYTGSIKKTFTITPYIVNNEETSKVTVTLPDEMSGNNFYYIKGGVSPQPIVTYSYTDNLGVERSMVLTKGTDYTVTYKNNKKTGYTDSVDKNNKSIAPVVIVNLKGSYKGVVTTAFNINSGRLSEATVVAEDKVTGKRINAWKAAISVKDKSGQKLSAGSDYNKSVYYSYVNETEVEQLWGNNIIREAGEAVDASDVPPAGTYIRVEVYGGTSGNYIGRTSGVYKIISAEYDLSKATVKIINPENNKANYYYTGSEVLPDKSNIHVLVKSGGKQVEVDPSCFVVESYKNNVKKGAASLTIRGVGQYGGRKTAAFTIISKIITK